MGSNQSKKSNFSTYEFSNGNDNTGDSLQRLKRRKSSSSTNLNRTPSSPAINAKMRANFDGLTNQENLHGMFFFLYNKYSAFFIIMIFEIESSTLLPRFLY